ncbi:hypothetical protein IE53DRAFT_326640 [Violaceomyces palustris]|uniref:Uncharacterized protein n=1 Tax=Violaceomyces palustris TaxID=1673888 RepID=A0ACD0P3C7_9BASI|nr:hypothetical protein IE53DRAFT_326640 [Violaceomyces palustris]
MPFGQLVIGSPGSGKTTYCHGMYQFLKALGRPVKVVNLDPANVNLPYPCHVDLNQLITVKDVMEEYELGPNAAMIYCVEYLEKNLDWLMQRLFKNKVGKEGGRAEEEGEEVERGMEYLLFDLPGQVELSTNHPSLRRIVSRLGKELDLRLVAVHLTDASHITDASRYVSLLLLALRAMLTLELPHINVLSKVDLLGDRASSGELSFNLDFYTQVQDLSYLENLLQQDGGRRNPKFASLNRTICEIVEDYGLVQFETLSVEDKRSMFRLLQMLDKAVGYVYEEEGDGLLDEHGQEIQGRFEPGHPISTAAGGASASALFSVADRGLPPGWGDPLEVQERWVDHRKEWDEWEGEQKLEQEEKRWEGKVWDQIRKVTQEEKKKEEEERTA